nr:MAG TPA: syndecan-2 protein [Caudoviricetes sp.]
MIATLETIIVWCLIVAVGAVGVLCAFIGLMFLIYYPKH